MSFQTHGYPQRSQCSPRGRWPETFELGHPARPLLTQLTAECCSSTVQLQCHKMTERFSSLQVSSCCCCLAGCICLEMSSSTYSLPLQARCKPDGWDMSCGTLLKCNRLAERDAVAHWLFLLPGDLGPFCMEFACFPCVSVGSLWVPGFHSSKTCM